MAFVTKNYVDLKAAFKNSVDNLLSHHKKKNIDELPEDRQWQIKFLQQLSARLDDLTISDTDKAIIFTGSMFVIRSMINDTYSVIPSLNSAFYRYLGDASGLLFVNQLPLKDEFILLQKFNDFFIAELSENGQLTEGMKNEHIFSQIKGFGTGSDNSKLLELHRKTEDLLGEAKKELMRANALSRGVEATKTSTHTSFFAPGVSAATAESASASTEETTAERAGI